MCKFKIGRFIFIFIAQEIEITVIMFNVCGPASNGVILGRLLAKLNNLPRCAETTRAVLTIVVTKLYISSALVSAMYGRSRELGLYLWGNRPLPTVQEHPLLVSGGWLPHGG